MGWLMGRASIKTVLGWSLMDRQPVLAEDHDTRLLQLATTYLETQSFSVVV
jgi:hypothetical protein